MSRTEVLTFAPEWLALREGAVDYLVKPWVEQRLAARLRAVLGIRA